ncbi:hypothetical protein PG994_003218 [Apiospora phragmitis]|uniref:Uncharacterized protein n=1 Tax=Apiospora phragmitis TaxID=2905665 RepID=A0ABR1VXF5_9PEZI
MEIPDEEDKATKTSPTTSSSSPLTSSPPSPTEAELELLCTEAGLRKLIRDRLPTAESPPNYVRLWLGGYFTYRGIDPTRADRFLWSGAEFQDLALAELVEAFRRKAAVLDSSTGPRRTPGVSPGHHGGAAGRLPDRRRASGDAALGAG